MGGALPRIRNQQSQSDARPARACGRARPLQEACARIGRGRGCSPGKARVAKVPRTEALLQRPLPTAGGQPEAHSGWTAELRRLLSSMQLLAQRQEQHFPWDFMPQRQRGTQADCRLQQVPISAPSGYSATEGWLVTASPPTESTTRAGAAQPGTARGPSHPGSQRPRADTASMGQGRQGPQADPTTAHGPVPGQDLTPGARQSVLRMIFLLGLM